MSCHIQHTYNTCNTIQYIGIYNRYIIQLIQQNMYIYIHLQMYTYHTHTHTYICNTIHIHVYIEQTHTYTHVYRAYTHITDTYIHTSIYRCKLLRFDFGINSLIEQRCLDFSLSSLLIDSNGYPLAFAFSRVFSYDVSF